MSFDLQALDRALLEQPPIQTLEQDTIPNADSSQSVFHHPKLTGFPEFKVQVFETVCSTNTVVWDWLQQGAGAGVVAIALTQQSGRGQWGHQWRSPKGGLYLSLALTPNLPVDQGGMLTLSSTWGIATALRCYGIPVGIKWLNDLVFRGCKLGGILTETRVAREYIHQAVIGVGINWNNPVPDIGINIKTILADQQEKPIASLEMLAAIVLRGIRMGHCYWQQHGTENLVTVYEKLLVNLGEEVTIDGQPGKIVGITPTGKLRVQFFSLDQTEICLEPGAVSLGYSPRA